MKKKNWSFLNPLYSMKDKRISVWKAKEGARVCNSSHAVSLYSAYERFKDYYHNFHPLNIDILWQTAKHFQLLIAWKLIWSFFNLSKSSSYSAICYESQNDNCLRKINFSGLSFRKNNNKRYSQRLASYPSSFLPNQQIQNACAEYFLKWNKNSLLRC